MTSNLLFNKIKQQKVFVIGDVMLDNYWFGHSDRMSPEAPVPIVSLQKKESRLGGALNVAANCIALGAQTYILSVIGKDEEANTLMDLCKKEGINTKAILQDKKRLTTTKARVISSDKHLLRIDNEQTTNISRETQYKFIDKCLKAIQIEKPDVIILQDYNKGVLTPTVIRNVIRHAKEVGCIICVDPKLKNFFAYKGVDIFKPNLKEVKEGLDINELKINKKSLALVHSKLKEKLKHKISFITLSEKGVFVQDEKNGQLFKAHKRNIVDVSGAGDTVISVAALVYASTQDKALMAQIANIAGGLVCEHVGVVRINKAKLKEATQEIYSN
jgi:rfaE bifunctional protein kinase chain/domain